MEKLAADQPIRTKDQDRLHRAPFAKQLAKALAGWRFDESLVVALYGAWGSGKSSIKFLTIESLTEDIAPKDRPDILHFNAWQFSGQDALAAAFFREVGKKLRGPNRLFKFSRTDARIARRWKSFAAGLSASREFVDVVREAIGTFAVVGGVTLFRIGRENLALIVLILGLMLTTAHRLVRAIADWFGAKAESSEKTVAEMKEDLAESLRKRPRPLLIVVDEIDRLVTDEIRMLFRLVKANADLPRLMYLLLFQRDKVEKALDDPPALTGSDYLKKIVQVGFDVPLLGRADLDAIVFEELAKVIRDVPEETFDSHRWGNLYYGGLHHFFGSLRDVYRYIGMLEFYQGLFGPAEHLDVNPVDLIALQMIRVFEPKLYDRLPEMKDLLTGRDFLSLQGDREGPKKKILSLLDGVSPERTGPVTYVLKQLFPPAEWAFDGSHYGNGFAVKWAKELRVCSTDVFDRYFSLRIGTAEISREEMDHILLLTGDRDKLVVEFRRFAASDRLKAVLGQLEYYVDEIDLGDAAPFVTAVFDVGDELSNESLSADTLISGLMHAVRGRISLPRTL